MRLIITAVVALIALIVIVAIMSSSLETMTCCSQVTKGPGPTTLAILQGIPLPHHYYDPVHEQQPCYDMVTPSQIPQPRGNSGWGYRNECATKGTLKYQQELPRCLIPKRQPAQVGFVNLSQDTAPVPVKTNPCLVRPPVSRPLQTPVAQSNPATF